MLIHAIEKTERKGWKGIKTRTKKERKVWVKKKHMRNISKRLLWEHIQETSLNNKIKGKYNQPLGGHGNRQVAPEKLLWSRSFTTLMFIRSCPS